MKTKRERKWFEDTLSYLFRMARAITNYGNLHTTPAGNITAEGRRKITKLMQIKYSEKLFWYENVSQVLAFVTNKQPRSQFGRTHYSIYDRSMMAAEETGFISSEEFAERMTT